MQIIYKISINGDKIKIMMFENLKEYVFVIQKGHWDVKPFQQSDEKKEYTQTDAQTHMHLN